MEGKRSKVARLAFTDGPDKASKAFLRSNSSTISVLAWLVTR